MGIFDSLTGDAGHQAADSQRNLLGALVPNLATTGQDAFRNAGTALTGGFAGARTDLTGGQNAATGAINTGAGGALGYLDQGQQNAFGQLGQARSDLTANGGAYAPLSALASQYGGGAGLYADALGINGAQGNQRAQGAFQTGPGYDFALTQGLDAINRRRNAGGMLNSGGADREAQVYGQGLANQNYQQWLSNLSPYNNLQLSATQGAAAGNQANNNTLANLGVIGANLANTGGQNRAAVSTGQGNSLADIANRYAMAQAGLDTGEGSALANNSIGGAQNWQSVFGSAIPQFNDTFKQDAKASTDASTNSLNLGMNLAKLAVGAAGAGGIPGLGTFGGASVADPTFGGFSRPGSNAASVRF